MMTPSAPTPARKSGMPKWLKRLLWLSLIPVLLATGYYSLWIYFFVLGGTISPAELVYSDPCGAGEYRLLLYEYDNGDGYFELVDRSGKVLDKLKFTEGTNGSIHWDARCLAVNVPGDDGRVILEVRPSRLEWEVAPQ